MSHRRLQQLIAGFSVCSLFLSYIPPTLAQELSEPSAELTVTSEPSNDSLPEGNGSLVIPSEARDPEPETTEDPIIEEPTPIPEAEPLLGSKLN